MIKAQNDSDAAGVKKLQNELVQLLNKKKEMLTVIRKKHKIAIEG